MPPKHTDLDPGTGRLGNERAVVYDGTVLDHPVAFMMQSIAQHCQPIMEIAQEKDIEVIFICFRPSPDQAGKFDQTVSTTCKNGEVIAARLSQALEGILEPETFEILMRNFAKWEQEKRDERKENG